MVKHSIDEANKLITLQISGKVTVSDFENAIKEFKEPLESWDDIRMLEVLHDFEGIEIMALMEDLKYAMTHFKQYQKFSKIAVVSDKNWVEMVSKVVTKIFPAEVKTYNLNEVDQARAWLLEK